MISENQNYRAVSDALGDQGATRLQRLPGNGASGVSLMTAPEKNKVTSRKSIAFFAKIVYPCTG